MGRGKHKTRVSLEDVAELVGLNVQTVRRHVREGKLNRDDLRSVVEYLTGVKYED